MPILLTEGVVIETLQFVHFLHGRSQLPEKLDLRLSPNYPVGSGNQDLRRSLDDAGILHDARGRIVQLEKHLHGDVTCDQRIRDESGYALPIVREIIRLHIGFDREIAEEPMQYPQNRARERDVQLHLEGRSGKRHTSDSGSVVMNPGRAENTAYTLPHDSNILEGYSTPYDYLADESIQVFNQCSGARRMPPPSGSTAVAPRIPGEHGKSGKTQLINQVLQSSRMLVTAVKKQNSAIRGAGFRGPMPEEYLRAVIRFKRSLFANSHIDSPVIPFEHDWLW